MPQMRNKRSKGNILIDLTSLLDVVFIVLLILICKLDADKAALGTARDDLVREKASLETTQSLYEDQLESMQGIADYVVMISVHAAFDPEDARTRRIDILNSDMSSVIPQIDPLIGTNESRGYAQLKDYIETYIKENPDRTIVLSLNEQDEDILYRDERYISNMFSQIYGENPENVRLKGVK